jgi:ribulose bisphosphate carboxylase small subunit
MSVLLSDTQDAELMALIELAGQLGAMISYVRLVELPQSHFARRLASYVVENPTNQPSRTDDLQRNALGRKRRKV